MQRTGSTAGIEVAYERHGDGKPIVCLHGGIAPKEYWMPVIPHFEEYGVVVPQRPGFGTCLDSPSKTSVEGLLVRETTYAEALVDAIDGTPILFGHSFGALTAIETATDKSVDGVVAYEPAILPDGYRGDADLAARMDALIEDGKREAAVKLYVRHVLHPDGIDDLDSWLEEWRVWPACVELAEEVVRMCRAVERYELPERLDVEAPTLVLSGTAGPDFLRESARNVHDALPYSRYVEFDGVSHSGPSEVPELVATQVEAFLGGSN